MTLGSCCRTEVALASRNRTEEVLIPKIDAELVLSVASAVTIGLEDLINDATVGMEKEVNSVKNDDTLVFSDTTAEVVTVTCGKKRISSCFKNYQIYN